MSMTFPTYNDYATITHDFYYSAGAKFTLMMWLKPPANFPTTGGVVANMSGGSSYTHTVMCQISGSKISWYTSKDNTYGHSTSDLVGSTWVHVAFRRTSDSNVDILINGVDEASNAADETAVGGEMVSCGSVGTRLMALLVRKHRAGATLDDGSYGPGSRKRKEQRDTGQ